MPALALTDTRLAAEQLPPAGLFRRAGGWIALGTAGSGLLTLAGPRLAGGPQWWFHPGFGSGRAANTVALYAGMALLSAGWLGLRRHAHLRSATPRQLAPVAVLWSLPLALGVPLFSHDVYSYLAQGTIAQLGLNPYHVAPAALGRLGHPVVMNAVDPFWRHATAPYGPLFLAVMSGISAAVGSHLIAGALLTRILALIGLVLVWVFVPRLARALGTDTTRAVWLAALSPLVLLQLASPSHNDLLMAGLLAAGVALAAERRPLVGIAVCTVAMTMKLPAGLAIAFIAVAWLRDCEDRRTRVRGIAQAALVVGATVAIVSVATGWGLDWVSGTLFSTPARVRLAITPATNVAWTLSSLLHDVGVTAHFHAVESVTRTIAGVLGGLIALVLLVRTRRVNMVRSLGVALITIAIAGPAAWPWYFSWGIVLLSATVPFQVNRAVPIALIAGAFLVKANGILLLPLRSAPIVLAVYAAIAVASWYLWRRRRGGADRAATASAGRAASPSALARSSP